MNNMKSRLVLALVLPLGMALVALGAVPVFDVAPATADAAPSVVTTLSDPVGDTRFNAPAFQADAAPSAVTTVSDPVGDAHFNAPAFQDVVFAQMTETASGDFELLMEMAGPVPVNPPLPPPGRSEIWWVWNFDLDPSTFPAGYPYLKAHGPAEFGVHVSWDGTEFSGTAVDRRPLLTGGAAIITPVTFSIDGTIVQADLAYTQIGAVPASFGWAAGTAAWSGPVGLSEGHHAVDFAHFNP